MNCTLLNMVIPTVAGIQLFKEGSIGDEFSTLFGRAKIELKEKQFEFKLQPVSVGDEDTALKLVPEWKKEVIRFNVQK